MNIHWTAGREGGGQGDLRGHDRAVSDPETGQCTVTFAKEVIFWEYIPESSNHKTHYPEMLQQQTAI